MKKIIIFFCLFINSSSYASSLALLEFKAFNTTGYINDNAVTGSSKYYKIILDSNSNFYCVGQSGTEGLIVKYRYNGTFDTTFNSTGYINTEGTTNSNVYHDIIVDSWGDLIVVGGADDGKALISCYSTNGTISSTFNSGNGFTSSNFGEDSALFYGVALQSDGKIVVVGQTFTDPETNGLIARYSSAGVLDTSFNSTGYIKAEGDTNSKKYHDVAIQSDGKIVAVGTTDNANGLIVRYNSDGIIDTSFNSPDGYINVEGVTNSNIYYKVLIQSDGKILVAGSNDESYALLVRYNSDGTIDNTFNDVGYIDTSYNNANYLEYYHSIAIDNQNRIVAVGASADDGSFGGLSDGLIGRYSSNGKLDTTFNKTGFVKTEGNTNSSAYYTVVLQTDGKIIAAGQTDDSKGLIAQYLANGILDSTANWTVKNYRTHYNDINSTIGLLK